MAKAKQTNELAAEVSAIVEGRLQAERDRIAREALVSVLTSGKLGGQTFGEVYDSIASDKALGAILRDLTWGEFRSLIGTGGQTPTAPTGTGPSRKRGVTAGRIVDFIKANPGCKRAEIMAALKLRGGTLSSQLRVLRAQDIIRGEGESRSLRYFVG